MFYLHSEVEARPISDDVTRNLRNLGPFKHCHCAQKSSQTVAAQLWKSDAGHSAQHHSGTRTRPNPACASTGRPPSARQEDAEMGLDRPASSSLPGLERTTNACSIGTGTLRSGSACTSGRCSSPI
jgi:hypothetical protein